MFQTNSSKDASTRPAEEREEPPTPRELPDAPLDPHFSPPRADQFRITDLQLWIDLSA